MRNLAAAYGTRAIFSGGSPLVTGLSGTESATPSSARQAGTFLALTVKCTGGCFPLKTSWRTSCSLTSIDCAGILRVYVERVVPRRGRKYLPVGRHPPRRELHPAFTDGVGEEQWPAFDGDRVVETLVSSGPHGERDLHAIAGPPGAFNTGKGSGRGLWLRFVVDPHLLLRQPTPGMRSWRGKARGAAGSTVIRIFPENG